MSKGRKGEELAELGQLVDGGAVAFTDDGAPVASAELMRRALEYCQDVRPRDHAALPGARADRRRRDERGVRVDAAGPARACPPPPRTSWSPATSAWPRSPAAGCTSCTSRPARSVELVREGKRRGVRVTAEACPHHFTLTDERLRTFDSNFKMNPPLRTWSDVEAVIAGLKDGTIEILATDHAPHAPEKKMRELDQAPFGIVGLETLIPITVTSLIEPGHLTWPEVIRKLTINPAQLLGIPKGTLQPGADADVTIIDPDARWTIDPAQFRSKSRNTPVRRLGGPRPGPHRHRRRRGPLHPGRDRPAGRRGKGLKGMAGSSQLFTLPNGDAAPAHKGESLYVRQCAKGGGIACAKASRPIKSGLGNRGGVRLPALLRGRLTAPESSEIPTFGPGPKP